MDTVLEFRPAPESQWTLVKPILAMRKITINGQDYTGSYPESVCNALGMLSPHDFETLHTAAITAA